MTWLRIFPGQFSLGFVTEQTNHNVSLGYLGSRRKISWSCMNKLTFLLLALMQVSDIAEHFIFRGTLAAQDDEVHLRATTGGQSTTKDKIVMD